MTAAQITSTAGVGH